MDNFQKRVLTASGVTAVLSGFFGPPDLAYAVTGCVCAFVAIFGILELWGRLLSIGTWTVRKQRVVAWSVGILVGVVMSLWPNVAPYGFVSGLAMVLVWLAMKRLTRPNAGVK